MEYGRLKGIKTEEYEYPGEETAFSLVKKVPLLDKIVAAYLKYGNWMLALPEVQGDCFRVTEETSPEAYRIYKTALTRLDMPSEYPLFAKEDYEYNAYTTGGSAPYIVIHSSMLKNLSEEELLFTLGHELGHIKSGHLIYYMMAQGFGQFIVNLPIPGIDKAAAALHYALIHWVRMQEYTADRAGALAAGSIEAGQVVLGRLLGAENDLLDGVHFTREDFLEQNATFEELNQNVVGKMISAVLIMNQKHPWVVNRIQALEKWKNSGSYQALLDKYVSSLC